MNKFIYNFKNLVKKQLLTVRRGLLSTFIFLAFLPLIVVIIFGWNFFVGRFPIPLETLSLKVLAITFVFLLVSIFFLLSIEVFFRAIYFIVRKEIYVPEGRVKSNKLYAKPHPYLPFVYKSQFATQENKTAKYPLHKGKFTFSELTTNNLGFTNGLNGDRDVLTEKPSHLYRINCLGASTTGNYISRDGKNFSYPLELEALLTQRYETEVEVNNFGLGGYNSADILIRFLLEVVDTCPDMIIIYHGHNDIKSYLTPNFKADYSHSRINLGENYWKFEIGEKLPLLNFHFFNFLLERWFPVGLRNSLLDFVSKGNIDLNIDPKQGLAIYKRNLEYLIGICKLRNIEVVLSTYAHFLYDDIKESQLHKKYGEIISEENKIIKDLAYQYKIPVVDNANLIPQEEKYFLDSIHFTPEGMQLLAKNFADSLKINFKK